jgi:hypothetical protein
MKEDFMKLHTIACLLAILLIVTGCSSPATPTPSNEKFLVTITGALEADFDETNANAYCSESDLSSTVGGLIVFDKTNGGFVQVVRFAFTDMELASGTYDIDTNIETNQPRVFVDVRDGEGEGDSPMWTPDRIFIADTGTLTLEVNEDGTCTGSFTLSMTGGEFYTDDQSQSISVEGTFTDIDSSP